MANGLSMPFVASNGGYDYAVFTGKDDLYLYEGGKRTNEKIGTKLTVALQGNRLLPLTIKIEGTDPLPDVTDEVILESCRQRKFLYVKIVGGIVKIYNGSESGIGMTATAKGAEIVGNSK